MNVFIGSIAIKAGVLQGFILSLHVVNIFVGDAPVPFVQIHDYEPACILKDVLLHFALCRLNDNNCNVNKRNKSLGLRRLPL